MSKSINDLSEINNSLESTSGGKVEITISGNVYDALLEAADNLRVSLQDLKEENIVVEMVMKAIALLLQSQSKEIISAIKKMALISNTVYGNRGELHCR